MSRRSPFIESIRRTMRLRGYSIRTEKSYLYWIRYYIRFHKYRHPEEMAKKEITEFLNFLASDRNVTANTQRIALNSLMFLYSKILEQPITNLGFKLASKPRYLPTVLSTHEAINIIDHLDGVHQLIVKMMYGSGLRVQDINLEKNSVTIRAGKGNKNRVTILSQNIKAVGAGTDIRTVQELLGHTDVKTTQIVSHSVLPNATLVHPCTSYTHILGKHYAGTSSPLDRISEERPHYIH